MGSHSYLVNLGSCNNTGSGSITINGTNSGEIINGSSNGCTVGNYTNTTRSRSKLMELGDNHVTNYYSQGTTNVKGILGDGGRNEIDNLTGMNGSVINIGGFLQELGDNHITNFYTAGTANVKGIIGDGGRNEIDNFTGVSGSTINIGGFLLI